MTFADIVKQGLLLIHNFLSTHFEKPIYKIGITAECNVRFTAYQRDEQMTKMEVALCCGSIPLVEAWEKAMIKEHKKRLGNMNIRDGGDGGLRKRNPGARELYGYVVTREGAY